MTVDDAFVVRTVDQVLPGIEVAKLGSAASAAPALRRLSGALVRHRERSLSWLAARRARLNDISGIPDLGIEESLLVAPSVAGVKASRPFAQAYLLTMLRNGDAILALVGAQRRRGSDAELTQLAAGLATDIANEQARIRDVLADLAARG